ncbi:Hypothetical predicted protein [Olea europaea subsp. europaea]|uniref:Uncharacterized protein n=1 Tax=Olea europaea subsp. europaea TaxID=158383 RepID=A0A8S0PQ68_OLEEU|nr:Hypothetical predicted protein [Olea europaea subsp. europaea]
MGSNSGKAQITNGCNCQWFCFSRYLIIKRWTSPSLRAQINRINLRAIESGFSSAKGPIYTFDPLDLVRNCIKDLQPYLDSWCRLARLGE